MTEEDIQKLRAARANSERAIQAFVYEELLRFQEATGLDVESVSITMTNVTAFGDKRRHLATQVVMEVRL